MQIVLPEETDETMYVGRVLDLRRVSVDCLEWSLALHNYLRVTIDTTTQPLLIPVDITTIGLIEELESRFKKGDRLQAQYKTSVVSGENTAFLRDGFIEGPDGRRYSFNTRYEKNIRPRFELSLSNSA